MSIAKAFDVAFVRFRVPEPGKMHQFLRDFGMVDAHVEADRVFMRGHGSAPFVHVSERGDVPEFAGFGIWLNSLEDLEALAAYDGLPIDDFDAPGGGRVVRLTDPDGFTVEAVAGHEAGKALTEGKYHNWNQGGSYPRLGEFRRVPKGASHVMRLGHVVLGVSNFRRSEAWYKERFGFITSDEIQPAQNVAVGAFMRCDRGDQPCDHHTLFLLEWGRAPGFMHAAYEVADLDDLMAGHDHLKRAGYDHQWGIGRHHRGSQVFDYWRDPYGNEIEHWTDGDQLVAADGGGVGSIEQLMGVQWGMEMPPPPPPPQAPESVK